MSQGSAGRAAGTVRRDLSTAAINLFLANGYDRTTVDDIAEAAGVARRTFFRHFRTKEDAVFPDHDACLRRVQEYLSRVDPAQPPLAAAGAAAHLVLAMYTEDAQASVRRYQVIREVEPLRERELIATSRYQRAFAEYLHRRLPGRETERLLHELAGTAVVAAHNFVLRQWLREGGTGDVHARYDAALRTLAGRFPEWLRVHGGVDTPERPDEVMVLMLRPDTPQWRIAQEIEAAARKSPRN
jgi:AcrR family transcriptional regulator